MLTMRTDISIAFPRPAQSGVDRISKIHTIQPRLTLALEVSVLDFASELIRPLLGLMIWLPPDAANPFLRDRAVPDMVEIELTPLPEHMNAVPAPGHIFVVQGLVDVSNKVHHELGGLRAEPHWDRRIEDLRGIVLDRSHHAPLILAVAVEFDRAVVGRLVLGVDEVEHARIMAPFRVSDGVGPRSHVGEVVGGVVSEEGLEVGCCLRLDKVTSKVGDSDVPKTWGS